MKKYFKSEKFRIISILFFYLFIISSVCSQTWVRTPYYDITNGMSANHDTTHVGPLEMCKTPNRRILTLMQIYQQQEIRLYSVDSAGNFLWNITTSISGSTYVQNSFSLHPTADNGCVYAYSSIGGLIEEKVFRLDSNGSVLWSKSFTWSLGYPEVIVAIVPTFYNTFYLQFTDSLVELDSSGGFIRNRTSISGNILALPDSSFILASASSVSRQNFNGSISWTVPIGNGIPMFADSDILYVNFGNYIMKLDVNNGNTIWQNNFPNNKISVTSDGGFIACGTNLNQDSISRYDSSGTLLWSRNIPFPSFGYTNIIESSPGIYITGGAFKTIIADQFYYGHGFSSFLLSLDSIGHGVVDSTDFYFNGNANDNNVISFSDDVAYVAAAINNTGPALDTTFQHGPGFSVFGQDWPGSFSAGYNYKYSDCNGDGQIDTADVRAYISHHIFPLGEPISQHWLKLNHNSVLPDLIFKCEQDSANPGDTVVVDLILGSSIIPVDSIYALSLTIFQKDLFNGGSAFVPVSNFGNPAVNLYSFFNYSPGNMNADFVMSRQDHQNAIVSGDTIVRFNFIISNINTGIYNFLVNFNAITKDGYTIPLNLILNDSIYVTNITGINSILSDKIKIYPNPANDELFINSGDENIEQLFITDNIGRILFSRENIQNNFRINLSEFSEGLYYISCITSNGIIKSKFIRIK